VIARAARADKRAHQEPGFNQPMQDRRSDEPARPGHENCCRFSHLVCIPYKGQGMNRNLAPPADAAAARKVSAHAANPSRGLAEDGHPMPFTAESSLQRYVSVAAGVFPDCVR